MATVNGFLCALGVSRAAYLVIEQYHLQEVLPEVVSRLLWDVGFPCLLAASIIIQYTFSELSQMSFGPAFLRRRPFLSSVICGHFFTVLITDLIAGLETEATALLYISQTVFIVWCLFIHTTFLFIGYKVLHMLNELPSSAFNNGTVDTNTKGIMQLALLARCGNIASSVIASGGQRTAAPPPKIRITDENERTVSFHSETAITSAEPEQPAPAAEETPSCERRPSDPVAPVRRPLRPTGRRCSESAATGRKAALASSDRSRSRSCCAPSEPDSLETISPAPAPPAPAASRPKRPPPRPETTARSSLLPTAAPPRDSIVSTDITLQTVLNHIAYISHPTTVRMSPKYQVRRILKVTYTTALLGVLLSAVYLALLYARPAIGSTTWLLLETAARSAEFFMGCCIANITKQPVQRSGGMLRQYH
ncbi:uncharacterized protein LOC122372641 [Amphibalanus amphitrite]|uniref:uncharacterized protein LOC122372641 n=1 Tax=Amphibalanus amphitrite TaxID=1232801 RepID=UPI001C92147C|nr:uncharacterized protein LOC122372641 [Amphibalanus amphitrite]